jgi:hypothetical protein
MEESNNKYINKAQEFVKRWLLGTTCFHHNNTIFWQDGKYIITKHEGHTEYIDRFAGSNRCPTRYVLYNLDDKIPDRLGSPYIKEWEGRWLERYWDELEDIIEDIEADICPECGAELRGKGWEKGGGIECTKCDYWFCF